MTGAGCGGMAGAAAGVDGAVVIEGFGAGAAAGFGAGPGATCRGIGGVGVDGANPFLLRSSRSNSLIDRPPAGFAPGPVGIDIVFGAVVDEVADVGVCCGFGTPEVIVPSLTTGCCDVAFDHPAAFDGFGGCGAGAGAACGNGFGAVMSRFNAGGGVPAANFGVATNASEIIFGAGMATVAATAAEIISGSLIFSSSGTGAYALFKSSRSAAKIFASIDFEISEAA